MVLYTHYLTSVGQKPFVFFVMHALRFFLWWWIRKGNYICVLITQENRKQVLGFPWVWANYSHSCWSTIHTCLKLFSNIQTKQSCKTSFIHPLALSLFWCSADYKYWEDILHYTTFQKFLQHWTHSPLTKTSIPRHTHPQEDQLGSTIHLRIASTAPHLHCTVTTRIWSQNYKRAFVMLVPFVLHHLYLYHTSPGVICLWSHP